MPLFRKLNCPQNSPRLHREHVPRQAEARHGISREQSLVREVVDGEDTPGAGERAASAPGWRRSQHRREPGLPVVRVDDVRTRDPFVVAARDIERGHRRAARSGPRCRRSPGRRCRRARRDRRTAGSRGTRPAGALTARRRRTSTSCEAWPIADAPRHAATPADYGDAAVSGSDDGDVVADARPGPPAASRRRPPARRSWQTAPFLTPPSERSTGEHVRESRRAQQATRDHQCKGHWLARDVLRLGASARCWPCYVPALRAKWLARRDQRAGSPPTSPCERPTIQLNRCRASQKRAVLLAAPRTTTATCGPCGIRSSVARQ